MEVHDGASKGKYTIGLGQDCMGFCTEVEDVILMRLNIYNPFINMSFFNFPVHLLSSGYWSLRVSLLAIVLLISPCTCYFAFQERGN